MGTVSLIGCGALASIFVQNFGSSAMNGSLSASTAEGKSKSAFEERFGLKVKTDF